MLIVGVLLHVLVREHVDRMMVTPFEQKTYTEGGLNALCTESSRVHE